MNDISLHFLGAADNVTGSSYLLQYNGHRFLVDCGLYQERQFKARNWELFPVPPDSIDAVFLTHAHLDHCGLLPKLVHDGFKGRIFCTGATAEIARIVLVDSANIQVEDAAFKKKRHEREGRTVKYPEIPLYNPEDAYAASELLTPVKYIEDVEVADGFSVSFHDAGHILGSAMVRVRAGRNGNSRSIVFSGDVGRWEKPILNNPTVFEQADYVLVESTYGDREHPGAADIQESLCEVVDSTWKAGGNVVVPSFALERTQEVLYYLNKLLVKNCIPHLMVFVDSPMAVSVTDVFNGHLDLFDEEMVGLIKKGNSPFDFPGLKLVRSVDDSKAINHIKGTVIIIAGSGMCTGGRIKHHLVTNISRPESTVMFVGYQAAGTLGRQIVEGWEEVRILGQKYPVKARVTQINGFSGHADRNELLRWLSGLQRPPKHVFVTHGEPAVAKYFADFIKEKTGWSLSIPGYKDRADIY